jgi:molybdopterin-guanine dinucleotide biosynthesis protein B
LNSSRIPLITFIGRSGAGKTTLIEKLIRELSGRGYRLAAIKHHTKNGFDIDVPGKDSWRFAQAGSQQVVIAAPDQFATYRKLDHELSLDEIAAGIRDVDVVLVEGYKKSNQPSIEVVRLAKSAELVGTPEQRIAVASDQPLELEVPWFHLDDIQGIADFIKAKFLIQTSHEDMEAP